VLGVLNIDKFARALRLWWPWVKWKNKEKIWVGLGNPCTAEDMEFFYAASTITVGSGGKASFWETPWLDVKKLKEIALLNFLASKKKWSIKKAMENIDWIGKINTSEVFSYYHATQYVELWRQLSHVQLEHGVDDDMVWNFTSN
jgi:hypothetical protein